MTSGKIAPSILSADFGRLAEEVCAVEEAGADLIHVDVMDGHFVPNLTIGPMVVKAVRRATSLPLDVHLMIETPERYVEAFADAGANYISVHQEACRHLHRVLQQIEGAGAVPAVVINPATPVCFVEPILGDIGMLLVMSVNPGFGGQSFIASALEKLSAARELRRRHGWEYLIEVDGGVKVDNARQVGAAGADVVVSGSGIFGTPSYRDTIAAMRAELDGGLASAEG